MNVTEDDPPVRLFAVREYATGAPVESPETQNFTLHTERSGRNQAGGDDGVNGFTNGGTERTEAKRRRGGVAGDPVRAARSAAE